MEMGYLDIIVILTEAYAVATNKVEQAFYYHKEWKKIHLVKQSVHKYLPALIFNTV